MADALSPDQKIAIYKMILIVALPAAVAAWGSAWATASASLGASATTAAEQEALTWLDGDGVARIADHLLQSEKARSILAGGKPIGAVTVGTIVPYAGKRVDSAKEKLGELIEVEEGWFLCNGARLERAEFAELFDVIGVTFGAPDSGSFNLPDLRGRVVVGAGSGDGVRERKLGDAGGEEEHTLTVSEMPRHDHKLDNFRNDKQDDYGFGGSERNLYVDTGSVATTGAGADQPHNNMPPFLVVSYVIYGGRASPGASH